MRGQPVTLNTLHDVDPTGLANGNVPVWDGTAKKYQPGTFASSTVTLTQQSANYTLVLADAGTQIEGTDASAQTITVPPNSAVAFLVGTIINVCQIGAGQITIAAGTGVTLRAPNGAKTAKQYSIIGLIKRGTDEWVISGDATT